MNCKETQTWLLTSETPALPPPPLAEHLRRCAICQNQHRQLLLVESHLQNAPLPLVPVAVRAQLMKEITATPVVLPARTLTKRRRRRWPVEHIVGYLAAAAASAIVGALLGHGYAVRGPGMAQAPTMPSAPAVSTVISPPPLTAVAEAAASTVVKPDDQQVAPAAPPEIAATNMANTAEAEPMPSAVTPDVTVPIPFEERPLPPVPASIADAQLLNDDQLLAALVDRHTQTANLTSLADRLTQLVALSDVLWTQTIKESQSTGSTGNLEWLGEAYTNIVEHDLPTIARELPPSQHETATLLATSLENRAAEVGMLLSAPTPQNAELLRKLQASAQHGSDRLTKKIKEPMAPRQRPSADSSNLMSLVVDETVAIVREDNPVERADHSTILAESFAKDIVLTSLRGDETRAAAMGGHFGRVLEQGVAANLKRIDPSKASYQQTRRYQQVVARTQQSILFLQQSLEAAPPQARQSLTLAMQQGGLAQLVPPPGPTRRVWIWSPVNFRWHRH